MTTLSLAFSFWPCCLKRGLLAPDEEYLPQSRIVPCRSKIKLAELLPSSRSCFAPIRSTLATRGSQRRPFALIPVRYPGQGARGGGAGHCPRVLKRYYEPVINLTRIIPRSRPKVHRPLKVRESGDARSLRTGDDRRRARRSSKSLSNPSCNRTRDAGPPRAHPTQRGREPADRRDGPIPSAYGSHQPRLGAMGLRRLLLPQPREAVRQSG